MAKEKVKLEFPALEEKGQVFYLTVSSDGKKLGDATISNDSIQWYSYKSKKATKLQWKKFDQIVAAFD